MKLYIFFFATMRLAQYKKKLIINHKIIMIVISYLYITMHIIYILKV